MRQNPWTQTWIQTPKNRVILFLVAVAILSTTVAILDSQQHVFGRAGSLAYMWCPGLAAILIGLVTRRPFKAIGWWTTKPKWLAVGWLIPIASATIAYGMVWITGLGGIPRDTFIPRARLTLHMPGQPDWLVITTAFGFITIASLIPSMISALGEEIGWRGFLVPELSKWISPQKAIVASGTVWSLWHIPAILNGYGAEGTPRAYQAACFMSMVMLSAIILGWLRLKSGSVWPAAVVHATHNAAIQMFFDRITAPREYTAYFIGEFGCALLLPLAIMAWFCMRQLRNEEVRVSEDAPVFTGPALRSARY